MGFGIFSKYSYKLYYTMYTSELKKKICRENSRTLYEHIFSLCESMKMKNKYREFSISL